MSTATIELRDYQSALIAETFELWQSGLQRLLLQAPTGAGKTVMLALIAKSFLDDGQRVLIVSHTTELVTQAAAKAQAITGYECGIIKAGFPNEPNKALQSGSVQSLQRRMDKVGELDLIIVDEAHHSTSKSYTNILKRWPDAYVLGCSATPRRLDKKGFDHLYDRLIKGPQVKRLMKDGYLSNYKLYAGLEMNLDGVRTTAGDFNSKDVAAANDAIELSGNLLDSYKKHASGKRAIVFAINVAHSKQIASTYQAAGIAAKHLDGNTSANERAESIELFKRGELTVLTNCGLFGEGVDIPAVACVQLARPSKSLSWYLQACGRALRPSPDKEYAVIIDHGSNWDRHALPDTTRRWSLTAPKSKPRPRLMRSTEGEIRESPAPPPAIREVAMQLQEIDEQVLWQKKLDDILGKWRSRNYKKGWVAFALKELAPPLEVWQKAAKALGYQEGWAFYKHQEQEQLAA